MLPVAKLAEYAKSYNCPCPSSLNSTVTSPLESVSTTDPGLISSPKNCLVTKMVIKKNTIDDFEDVLDYHDNLELGNENLYYPSIEYSDPEILLIYPFRKYIN